MSEWWPGPDEDPADPDVYISGRDGPWLRGPDPETREELVPFPPGSDACSAAQAAQWQGRGWSPCMIQCACQFFPIGSGLSPLECAKSTASLMRKEERRTREARRQLLVLGNVMTDAVPIGGVRESRLVAVPVGPGQQTAAVPMCEDALTNGTGSESNARSVDAQPKVVAYPKSRLVKATQRAAGLVKGRGKGGKRSR